MKTRKEYIIKSIDSIDIIPLHRFFLECVARNNQSVITDEILDSIDFLINRIEDDDNSPKYASAYYLDGKTSLCLELIKLFKGRIVSPDAFAEKTRLNDRFFYDIKNNKKNNMTQNTLLSIIFALGLNEEQAIILFSLSKHNYNTAVKPIYKGLLRLNINLSIDIINAYLLWKGCKPLGSSTYNK